MGVNLSGPVALLFPGQGVQRPGMGWKLYQSYPAARRVFERAEEVLGMPVRRLCFEGPAEELNRTDVLQPCVMTVCWAAYEIWRESYGMEHVRVMAGHSLGEFTALAAAGAISWETALLLVKERGRIMAEASREHTGGMLAIVGLDEEKVEAIRTRLLALGRTRDATLVSLLAYAGLRPESEAVTLTWEQVGARAIFIPRGRKPLANERRPGHATIGGTAVVCMAVRGEP